MFTRGLILGQFLQISYARALANHFISYTLPGHLLHTHTKKRKRVLHVLTVGQLCKFIA